MINQINLQILKTTFIKNKKEFKKLTILALCLFIILIPVKGTAELVKEHKGQFSLSYIGHQTSKQWNHQSSFRYIPDLTLKYKFPNDLLWDINASANIFSEKTSDCTLYSDCTKTKIYRLNTQLKTSHSDLRVGLQKINFGPAVILRSLMWFDQINPTDPLQFTEGVIGIRYRYFFMNNANIWLWSLYGNKEPKGYEWIATQKNTPEFGARVQYPLQNGELGFSIHGRQTENLNTANSIETRYAIDGRFNLDIGLWYEYVLFHQGTNSEPQNKWFESFTLGTDYTLGIGNGLHITVEHLITNFRKNIVKWGKVSHTSAVQISYPISVLDSISFLEMFLWEHKQSIHYLSWNRSYNDWMFNLGVFSAPKDLKNNNIHFSGHGLYAMIIFNY